MAYRIELSQRAFADLDEIVAYIAADSPKHAIRWKDRLLLKIASLANHPRAYGPAPEAELCRVELRQTFVGKYRILFRVDNAAQVVRVVTVRHGARRWLEADELDALD
jgi:plasmid stabilization system protein ParE